MTCQRSNSLISLAATFAFFLGLMALPFSFAADEGSGTKEEGSAKTEEKEEGSSKKETEEAKEDDSSKKEEDSAEKDDDAAKEEGSSKKEKKVSKKKKSKKGGDKDAVVEEKPKVLTPAVTQKNGRPMRDRMVEFEAVLCASQGLFEVGDDVRHNYPKCQKASNSLAKLSKNIMDLHEDQLRFRGKKFHYNLELMATDAHRLSVAVAEHNRKQIFAYWSKLLTMRSHLIAGGAWK